jgi:hypothetical protein
MVKARRSLNGELNIRVFQKYLSTPFQCDGVEEFCQYNSIILTVIIT